MQSPLPRRTPQFRPCELVTEFLWCAAVQAVMPQPLGWRCSISWAEMSRTPCLAHWESLIGGWCGGVYG